MFRKPVSTIEKLYLVYNRLRPPFANQVVVEVEGRVDAGALAAALARATAANPGSSLRMTGRLGLRAWVPGPAPRLTFVADTGWDGRSDEGAPFLHWTLEPEGPTCELQVIDGGARAFLVFRSLHGVMDGVGTLFWAQDVFRALRGEEPLGHPSDLTDTQLAAGLTDTAMALPPYDALHPCGRADAPSSGNEFVWRRVTIPDPTDAPLVATLLVTLAAEARRHGDGPVRFNVPADLRPFRKDQRSTGNGIGTLFVEVAPGATVADVASDLRARLKAREHARFPAYYEQMRWLPLGALEAGVRRALSTEHERGRYSLSATVSYLGAMDAASVSAAGLTARTLFWVPPMADQSCFVTCDRVGGALELALALPRVHAGGGRFEALLDKLTRASGRG